MGSSVSSSCCAMPDVATARRCASEEHRQDFDSIVSDAAAPDATPAPLPPAPRAHRAPPRPKRHSRSDSLSIDSNPCGCDTADEAAPPDADRIVPLLATLGRRAARDKSEASTGDGAIDAPDHASTTRDFDPNSASRVTISAVRCEVMLDGSSSASHQQPALDMSAVHGLSASDARREECGGLPPAATTGLGVVLESRDDFDGSFSADDPPLHFAPALDPISASDNSPSQGAAQLLFFMSASYDEEELAAAAAAAAAVLGIGGELLLSTSSAFTIPSDEGDGTGGADLVPPTPTSVCSGLRSIYALAEAQEPYRLQLQRAEIPRVSDGNE